MQAVSAHRAAFTWATFLTAGIMAALMMLAVWAGGSAQSAQRALDDGRETLHRFELAAAEGRSTFWRLASSYSPENAAAFKKSRLERDALVRELVAKAEVLGLSAEADLLRQSQFRLDEASRASWALLEAGEVERALALAGTPRFLRAQADRIEATRTLHTAIEAALNARHAGAQTILHASLGLGALGVFLIVFIWLELMRFIARQRADLIAARDALQAHSAELEARVAQRTLAFEHQTEHLIRARDAAESANRAKSRFLAVMSHEIRTPLNGVIGMAQALEASPLDADQRRMVAVMRGSSDHLLTVINDLLDMSKIEAGQCELEYTDLVLTDMVASVVAIFEEPVTGKGLSLRVEATPACEGWFIADATRLRQIVLNLVGNAVKFTHAGEIVIQADVEPIAEQEVSLRLSVADTGIGMNEETLARLFRPFMQADASTTRRFGGTGLGLSISRELARLMHGDIRVASAPGEGSVFTLVVPLVQGQAPADVEPCEQAAAMLKETPLRLLAAEDNANNRAVLQVLMRQAGVDITFAENGAEAVETWRAQRFDLILMDMQMPVMSGVEATRAIREAERAEGREAIPILALSANAMSHHVSEAIAAGMNGHVAKPIDAAHLFKAIEIALAPAPAAADDFHAIAV
jgi:signal transduction histidine kinase/ActR/RegA family two-component response regulator